MVNNKLIANKIFTTNSKVISSFLKLILWLERYQKLSNYIYLDTQVVLAYFK